MSRTRAAVPVFKDGTCRLQTGDCQTLFHTGRKKFEVPDWPHGRESAFGLAKEKAPSVAVLLIRLPERGYASTAQDWRNLIRQVISPHARMRHWGFRVFGVCIIGAGTGREFHKHSNPQNEKKTERPFPCAMRKPALDLFLFIPMIPETSDVHFCPYPARNQGGGIPVNADGSHGKRGEISDK